MSATSIGKYLLLLSSLFATSLYAQQDVDKVEIKTMSVADGIYMLQGQGGNIGLSVGNDGVFMVDDQFAPLSKKILAAIGKLTDKPVKFLINTHWHYDHTGGNENFGKAGAIIVAHKNVRERLLNGGEIKAFNRVVPKSPLKALPVVTFDRGVTFHWNGDTLEVKHINSAHTDGDAVIYFKKANVVHMGDVYFNGSYPFIDASSGGAVAGVVQGVAQVLANIDDNTKIIPGHGPLSNKRELKAYHQMLSTVYKRVKAMKEKGKSREEVIAAKPTADFDAQWGKGFLPPDKWVGIVYTAI